MEDGWQLRSEPYWTSRVLFARPGTTIASVSGRDVTLVTNDFSQARARRAGLEATTVAAPLYDVDIREEAREAERNQEAQDAADMRAAQESEGGRRKERRAKPGGSSPIADADRLEE
ncbi:MAG: hypothetical protein JWO76_1401 [Nocardioides sp.]|nr:hypothetical protein [Nocardioides sp.]